MPNQNRPRSERLDREIDQNLKRAFDSLASEPVPDRFNDLLKQLKEKGAGQESAAQPREARSK